MTTNILTKENILKLLENKYENLKNFGYEPSIYLADNDNAYYIQVDDELILILSDNNIAVHGCESLNFKLTEDEYYNLRDDAWFESVQQGEKLLKLKEQRALATLKFVIQNINNFAVKNIVIYIY